MSLRPRTLVRVVTLIAAFAASTTTSRADTIQLRNGEYIDGIVTARNNEVLVVRIGDIGTLEIPVEAVVRVEKNSRTGTRKVVPVDSRELQLPDLDEGADGAPSADGGKPGETPKAGEPAREAGTPPVGGEKEAAPKVDAKTQAEIDKLVYQMQRERAKHRHRAERRLTALGAVVVPSILPLAIAHNEHTRSSVFRIISTVAESEPDVIKACLKALDDSSAFVRENAVLALRRLSGKKFAYASNAHASVRTAAAARWREWWEGEETKATEAREKEIEREIEKRLRAKTASSIEKQIEDALERKLRERQDALNRGGSSRSPESARAPAPVRTEAKAPPAEGSSRR